MAWSKVKKTSLHYNVSERTIWNWIADEILVAYKVNGVTLIDLDASDKNIRQRFARKKETAEMVDDLLKGLTK